MHIAQNKAIHTLKNPSPIAKIHFGMEPKDMYILEGGRGRSIQIGTLYADYNQYKKIIDFLTSEKLKVDGLFNSSSRSAALWPLGETTQEQITTALKKKPKTISSRLSLRQKYLGPFNGNSHLFIDAPDPQSRLPIAVIKREDYLYKDDKSYNYSELFKELKKIQVDYLETQYFYDQIESNIDQIVEGVQDFFMEKINRIKENLS